jgi:hypothetical protein
MNRMLALAASLLFASSAALANHCPKDMADIDAALAKNPQLSEKDLAEVKKLRAQGEVDHKANKHQESMDELAKAKAILGLK